MTLSFFSLSAKTKQILKEKSPHEPEFPFTHAAHVTAAASAPTRRTRQGQRNSSFREQLNREQTTLTFEAGHIIIYLHPLVNQQKVSG